MQPVKGTLPSDRRKSCPELAGPQQPLGSRQSGGLGEPEPWLPRLWALCPLAAAGAGPSSPAVGPYGPSPSQEVSDPVMLSTDTWRKPGVYFVPTSKCLYIPLLLRLCPDGQLWPTPQPGILLLCQLDSERPSSSSSNFSLVFLHRPRAQTPENGARAAWTLSLWAM